MMTDHLLLGWYLSRPVVRPPDTLLLRPELLPGVILSGASCMGTTHPETWDDVYHTDNQDFILARSVEGYWGWGDTCYLKSPVAAAEVNEHCFSGSQNIYGLAIPAHLSLRLFQEIRDSSTPKATEPIWTAPLAGDEILLGYDVMGFNYGWTTFQCNYLHSELFDVFGVRLNDLALIPALEQAAAFAEYINAHDKGEPGWYAPYAVLLPGQTQFRPDLPPVPCRWAKEI